MIARFLKDELVYVKDAELNNDSSAKCLLWPLDR